MVPEPRPLQSKEILKKIRLEVIKFISVCLSLIFSISVLTYGIIQSKNSAKYGSGMGLSATRNREQNRDLIYNPDELFNAAVPDDGRSGGAQKLNLPGVFNNRETLQKYLAGFIVDLEEPDKADEDYNNWKNGVIEKDVRKTIADM